MNTENKSSKADELIRWIQGYACTRINSNLIDERRCIPPHIFLDFGNQGLLGMYVPKIYGGLGLSNYDIMRVLEQVAAIDMSLAVVINDSILSAYTLLNATNEEAKNEYLPLLASGRILAGNAITEPVAGSDPRKIESTAIPDGTGGWLLNGTKLWVGNASWAKILVIFVKQLDESGNFKDITGFIVPTDTVGVHIGEESLTMGMKGFVKNTVYLKNVRVSSKNLLNMPSTILGMVGVQSTMQYIRMCLGMICIGSSKRCIQLMHRYSSRRQIATGFLLDNPVTQIRLSQLIAETTIVDTFIKYNARLMDMGCSIPEEIFIICKNSASNCIASASDMLIQNLGARGYEEVNIAPKIFRDARPFRIFEGPNEVLDMYLGSKVANNDKELFNFISDTLKLQNQAEKLRHLLAKINKGILEEKSFLFQNTQKTQYWSYSLMAEVTTNFVLNIVFKKAVDQKNLLHTNCERMNKWIEKKLEQSIQTALDVNATESACLSIATINHMVASYKSNIGDIEQTLPGGNQKLDQMLKTDTGNSDCEELKAAEWNRVLNIWNQTDIELSEHKTVQELFSDRAIITPDKIAISFEDKEITYIELENRTNQLAIYLQRRGIRPDTIVGIYLHRSIDAIIAFLAVLKAGGAYLPLDTSYPKERLEYMLHDSNTFLVITQRDLKSNIADFVANTFVVEDDWSQILHEQSEELQKNYDGKHLAYIIYTSGSTGDPKGVMIEHRSLMNLVTHAVSAYSITPADRVLQFSSLSFDAAVEEIFPCLIAGATLVLRTEQMLNSSEIFSAALIQKKITIVDLPTAYWHQWIGNITDGSRLVKSALRLVIIGGEKVNATYLNIWNDLIKDGDIKLINTYGPTEATVITTGEVFSNTTYRAFNSLPIGKPIANTKLYVLNKFLRPVPINSIGELYIGGIGLARGYLNRPDLTAEKFVDNPFDNCKSKIYKTGDLVRYYENGSLEFIGRTDQQVKIRGFRVEIGEVENVILQYPNIREVAIITKIDASSNNQLISFIILDENIPDIDFLSSLRDYIKRKLPVYMRPISCHILEEMPLTINGKIDKVSLQNMEVSVVPATQKSPVPNTDTERKLISILQDSLQVPVRIQDNFISLGGHSLLAIYITAKIRQEFNIELSMHTLFSEENISKIANKIDDLLWAQNSQVVRNQPVDEVESVELLI